jgi:hypothetical protein
MTIALVYYTYTLKNREFGFAVERSQRSAQKGGINSRLKN